MEKDTKYYYNKGVAVLEEGNWLMAVQLFGTVTVTLCFAGSRAMWGYQ
jgi:hypothetical protein